MADTQLTTGTGGGTQTTTSSPQSAGASTGYLPATSAVQTGTSTSVLEGQGSVGIPLNINQPVTNVALGQQTTTATTQAPPAPHHVSPLAIAAIVVLVLFAIGTFITTSRSAKNNV